MKDAVREKGKGAKREGTHVLDTTVVLYDPDVFYRLQGRIVIPTSVIKEIDGLKRRDDNVGYSARKVARTLDVLGSYKEFAVHGDLATGVRLSTGGVVLTSPVYELIDALDSEADNKVVGTALHLKKDGEEHVTLWTSDINMRTAARAYGIKTRHYPAYMEDIAELVQMERARQTPVDSRCCALACERIANFAHGNEQRRPMSKEIKRSRHHEKSWLRRVSPPYYLQNILRALLPKKEESSFWTMSAEQYRLCVEYCEYRKSARGDK